MNNIHQWGASQGRTRNTTGYITMLVYVISLKIVIVGTCLYVAVLLFAVPSNNICYTILLILIGAQWVYKRLHYLPLNFTIYGNVWCIKFVIHSPRNRFYKIIRQGCVTYLLTVGWSVTTVKVNIKGQGCRFVLS